ncbi:hypothetical protein HUU05_25270 [candidate division KSB1 bacterium]|nr:hypothetical protein [candidate division KSB1 bacterium]
MVLIDGGNFGEAASGPSAWKSCELFKIMHKLKYDAVTLGLRDLSPGFADSVAKWNVQEVLFSSLPAAVTKMNLPPAKVVSRSGFELGLISLVSPNGGTGSTYNVETFLREQIDALGAQQVDFQAVVYLGMPHELIALSKKFPEIDLWLQSNGNHRPLSLIETTMTNAPIVSAGDRGREVGFITIEKEKNGARVASSFHQLILTDRIADSPRAVPLIEGFRKAGKPPTPTAPATPPKSPGASNGSLNPYIGSIACQNCHKDIFAKWEKTRHAHAFATLTAKREEQNAECLECHTTGFREETGYSVSAATAHLVQVGCESCHGRGGFHVRMNGRISNFVKITETTCLRCHTPKQSPKFAFTEARLKVH